MQVIALMQGFYNGTRYRQGAVIEWDVRDKLARWVKPVDPLAAPEPEPEAPPLPDWKKIGRADEYPPAAKFAKMDTRKPTAGSLLKQAVKSVTKAKAKKSEK